MRKTNKPRAGVASERDAATVCKSLEKLSEVAAGWMRAGARGGALTKAHANLSVR
ncbi:MAG TPA: hypothetical protein VJT82_10020 [Pyrinomonadaceae bacterium]|nr:hypothetical protein [Pyrinomonadaceae bacterium]